MSPRIIAYILRFRFLALIIACFVPFSLPEIWRQSDTLGVTLRYWIKWTAEIHPHYWFLPSTLNSGSATTLAAMEFPLLNFLTAPFFVFGPYFGKVFAHLFVVLAGHGLCLLCVRSFSRSDHQKYFSKESFWLLLIASFAQGWTGKYISDFLSVLFVAFGVLSSLEREPKWTRFFIFSTLGVLMKPTSVIVLLLPIFRSFNFKFFWRYSLAALVPALTGAAYYIFGIAKIRSLGSSAGFAIALKPFFEQFILEWHWRSLYSVFENMIFLLLYRPFFKLGFPLVFFGTLYFFTRRSFPRKKMLLLWLTLLLQIFVIFGLSGAHLYTHDYYLLGAAPTCVLILGLLFKHIRSNLFHAALLMGIAIPNVEQSLMDLKGFYREPYISVARLSSECRELIRRNPNLPWGRAYIFRSSVESYPTLGLCFGEMSRSPNSDYGFFYKTDQDKPAACETIDTSAQLILAKCVN